MSEAMKADLIEVIAMEMSKIDVIWLDQLTPNIAFAIWQAALSQQPAQPTVKEPLTVQAQETDREVVRYSFEEGSLDIKEDEFGNYIEISDYEALRAENEKLKEALKETIRAADYW
jgi:hypothetical protein